ncbi:MAG TPA: hypothetical protein VFD16_02290 [Candidatus Saccharimonadales bacterium]|nr:hypothetical protein [Candidatus Saccharimonadales bacterium]
MFVHFKPKNKKMEKIKYYAEDTVFDFSTVTALVLAIIGLVSNNQQIKLFAVIGTIVFCLVCAGICFRYFWKTRNYGHFLSASLFLAGAGVHLWLVLLIS